MEDKRQLIQQFEKKERELTAKLDRLMRPVEQLKDELAALRKAKAVFLREEPPLEDQASGFPMYRLRDKTQLQALFEIADYHGGTVDVREVKTLLIEAKLMRDTRNTAQMVSLLISRSGAFERIERGKYRLIASKHRTSDTDKLFSVHPSKPVQ